MELFLQQVLNGLVIGSTYAVVAIGFSLAFTVLRVINFAHPDIFMIGMFGGLMAGRLVSGPKLLLMDEPSLGLAPIVVADVFKLVGEINKMGISILMVEQNARQALRAATYAYLLEVGRMVGEGGAAEMAATEQVQEIFLGGRA